MKSIDVLRHMGKQITNGKTVTCPICSDDRGEQPMMAMGDCEEILFCPHCDLTVNIGFVDSGCSGVKHEN